MWLNFVFFSQSKHIQYRHAKLVIILGLCNAEFTENLRFLKNCIMDIIIKKQLSKVFDFYLEAGYMNKLDVVGQIMALLFLKSLEDFENNPSHVGFSLSAVLDDHPNFRWSMLLEEDPESANNIYMYEILPFLCEMPLDLRLKFFPNILKIRMSDKSFSSILKGLDDIFQVILSDNSKVEDKTKLYGDIYECLITFLAKSFPTMQILRAPKHLRQLICELAQVNNTDTVYDPTMGTGELLVDAYEQMKIDYTAPNKLSKNTDGLPKISDNDDSLFTEWSHDVYLEGDEDEMVLRLLCQMNFYFHNISLVQPQFKEGDGADLLKNRRYQKILGVIPSNKHTGDIVEQALSKLNPNGMAVLVVPSSYLYGHNKKYFDSRQNIITVYEIQAVISLPPYEFAPQASINTAILVVKNGKSLFNQTIWFCDLVNDGYSNDNKRVKNASLPLPELLEAFRKKEEIHTDCFDGKRISVKDVLDNNYSLLSQQYVDSVEEKVDEMDLEVIINHLDYLQSKIKRGIEELRRYL